MQVTALMPLGAVVTGVRVGALDEQQTSALRGLLAANGVIVLPGPDVDDGAFVDFLRSFGDLQFTEGETPVPGCPDLNLISNVGRARPPRSTFHTDTSYVRDPPAYTALRAVTVPARGGETLFSDQYRAYDTLPAEVRRRLGGRTVTHVVTGLDLDDASETSAEHPLFRVHPVSGRVALFLSTPARCVGVSGMDRELAEQTIADLFAHSTADANVYHHRWTVGDVVMWDNRCVMHRADHGGVVGDRIMHRGMVADGGAP